jgi:hypothetical protein
MAYNTRNADFQGNYNFFAAPPDYMDMNVYGDGVNDNPYQNIASTNQDKSPLMIGTMVQTFDGRIFKYIKYTDAGASGVVGNVLGPVANATVANITGQSNVAEAPYVEDTAATWTVGQFKGFWVNIGTGTGLGQTRRVVWNTATRLYLERKLDTAASTDSDLIIWSPHHVRQTPAASGINQRVSGVSIGALTTTYYGWMQVFGFCEKLLVDAVMASNSLIVPSAATAGYGLMAVGATTEDETFFAYGLQAGGTAQGLPAHLFACQG